MDRFKKLVRTVPLKKVTATRVTSAFVNDGVFVYGPTKIVVYYNGTKYTFRFCTEVWIILGSKNLYTTTYN